MVHASPAPRRAAAAGVPGRVASVASGDVERDARLADVAEPLLRLALEAAAEQRAERGRSRRRQRGPVDLLAQDRSQRVAHGLALEEPLAAQHLEEHDSEGPDVGPLVDRAAAGLLGGHVAGGAEDQAGGGAGVGERRGLRQVGRRSGRRVAAPGLGEPEVEHLDLAVRRDLHVRGLQVAVDDAFLVRFLERLGDLACDLDRLLGRDRSAPEPLREVLAEHELHGEEADGAGRAVGPHLLEREQPGDVRVRQRRQQLGLALEALEPRRVGREGVGQELERDAAPEPRVGRLPDLAHPARSEPCLDLVGSEAHSSGEGHQGFSSR